MNLSSFLIGFVSLLAHVIFVPVLIRLLPKAGSIALHIFSGISIHLVTVLIFVIGSNGTPYWPLAAIYWLGFMVYWYVFGSFYTSMTLKTLRMLHSSPLKSLQINEIYKTCFENTFVERSKSLISMGLAKEQERTVFITENGKKTANAIRILNKIFGIDASGLYLIDEEKNNKPGGG